MLHAVIMAGGSGTRFWPKSRRNRPKQLLTLFGERTMIQQTLDRIAPMIPPERVLVITGKDQAAAIHAQLPELPAANIIGEPAPRDTAPCVGLAAHLITRRDPQGVMLVLSADHRIEPPAEFRRAVQAACEEVEENPGAFVVFGVTPSRPETGYGYIERAGDGPISVRLGLPIHRVLQFKEKPDRATAEHFVAAGRFLWNAGIFVWKAVAVLDALRQWEPRIAAGLDRIAADLETPRAEATLAQVFPEIKRMPIDKAVMERHPDVRLIESTYEWSDVGDWRSLAELIDHDAQGNAVQGRALLQDSRETIVIADEGRPIVTLGVEGLAIVQSGGVTLVARKDRLDDLKKLVEGLGEAGLGDTL